MKKFFLIFGILPSIIFLIYLVWPYSPASVYDFKTLPDSTHSKLSGDTIEVKDLTAYFSNNYRSFVIPYYQFNFQKLSKFPFSPLRLIHPPEYAFFYIKDQTQSTYLEEFVYPFRSSLFINGLEPFDEKTKEPRYSGATAFGQDGENFETKVILRYYPSKMFFRIIVWLGINLAVVFLWKVGKRVFKNV